MIERVADCEENNRDGKAKLCDLKRELATIRSDTPLLARKKWEERMNKIGIDIKGQPSATSDREGADL